MLDNQKVYWRKSAQVEIIRQIVKRYPTAKDFKQALLDSNKAKLIDLAKSIDENMDRYQYIDYLQHVFVKYSETGKFLTSILSGIGLGFLIQFITLGGYLNNKYNLSNNADIFGKTNLVSDYLSSPRALAAKSGTSMLAGQVLGGIAGGATVNHILSNKEKEQQKIIDYMKKGVL